MQELVQFRAEALWARFGGGGSFRLDGVHGVISASGKL
jgi:hypothetical protein